MGKSLPVMHDTSIVVGNTCKYFIGHLNNSALPTCIINIIRVLLQELSLRILKILIRGVEGKLFVCLMKKTGCPNRVKTFLAFSRPLDFCFGSLTLSIFSHRTFTNWSLSGRLCYKCTSMKNLKMQTSCQNPNAWATS